MITGGTNGFNNFSDVYNHCILGVKMLISCHKCIDLDINGRDYEVSYDQIVSKEWMGIPERGKWVTSIELYITRVHRKNRDITSFIRERTKRLIHDQLEAKYDI
ncbi:MAG: hypothetical protein KDH96_00235 [Candidatus Riesia sp.]|nr:hypothetical protein [Candidatus Riesia sp.]